MEGGPEPLRGVAPHGYLARANWTYIVWGLLNYGLLMWEKYGGLGKSWPKFWGWLYTSRPSSSPAWSSGQTPWPRQGATSRCSSTWAAELPVFRAVLPLSAGVRPLHRGRGPLRRAHRDLAAGKVGSLRSGALLPAWDALSGVCLMAIFLLSVCFIVKGTYNPFIYFNF